jgi:DNA-directed RNA polymerase specialized sigma24 family protein/protocatechuate 3,4-dioxygenase beta subunit
MLKQWLLSDDQLVRRTLNGGAGAFAVLIERYLGAVYALAFAHTANPGLAREIARDTLVDAYRRLDSLRTVGGFGRWIMGLARARAAQVVQEPGGAAPHTAAGNGLWHNVSALSESAREILAVHLLTERSPHEIAELLWIPTHAADSVLREAKSTWAAQWNKLAGTLAAQPLGKAEVLEAVRQTETAWSEPAAFPAVSPARALLDAIRMSRATRLLSMLLATVVVAAMGTFAALEVLAPRKAAPPEPLLSYEESSSAVTVTPARAAFTEVPEMVLPNNEADPLDVSADPRPQRYEDDHGSGLGLLITGRVTDPQGRPLPGTQVRAYTSGPYDSVGFADSDGHYVLPGLASQSYRIRATSDRYVAARPVTARAGSSDINFVLQPKPSIAGRVIYADSGEPVRSYHIRYSQGYAQHLQPQRTPQQLAELGYEWVEHPDGRFSFPHVEVGIATITVIHPGYKPGVLMLPNLDPGEHISDAVIRLTVAQTVEAVVTDPDGQPLEGAAVYFEPLPSDRRQRERSVVTRTDSTGLFILDSLHDVPSRIIVAHPDFSPRLLDLALPGDGSNLNTVIALSRGSHIRGRVSYGTQYLGQQTVEILYSRDEPRPAYRMVTRTSPAGEYVFENAPPGTGYVVAAQWRDPEARVTNSFLAREPLRQVAVLAQVDTEYDLELDLAFATGPATLQGQLTLDGRPSNQGTVATWFGDDVHEQYIRCEAARDGRFEMSGLPAGEYTIHARALFNDVILLDSADVSIEGTEPLTRDFAFGGGARLTGNVRGLGDTAGTGVVVRVLRGNLDEAGGESLPVAAIAFTSENLNFAVPALQAGEYTVVSLGQDRDYEVSAEARSPLHTGPFWQPNPNARTIGYAVVYIDGATDEFVSLRVR